MNLAPKFKTYNVLIPKLQTATASGVGINVVPGSPELQAIAIASLGAATGAPSSYTVIITVEESATLNGTYDTLGTFATCTGAGNIAALPVLVSPAKPFIRATATIAFVGGTSPAVPVGVVLLVPQNVNTDSNLSVLS